MRLSNGAKQILALLLTGTLVSAMAPYNVIGAPVESEPSQSNQQRGVNTLSKASASYATVTNKTGTDIGGVFTKDGDSYKALNKSDTGVYFSPDRGAKLYYKPLLLDENAYIFFNGSYSKIDLKITHATLSEKTFTFVPDDKFGSFPGENGTCMYVLSAGSLPSEFISYLGEGMTKIVATKEAATETEYEDFTEITGETGKYLCQDENGKLTFVNDVYSVDFAASDTTSSALKIDTNGAVANDDTVTDAPLDFTVTSSSDKAYTGDTLTLSVSEPDSLSSFGTRTVSYYVTIDGNSTPIDGSEYTIPQDVSGKTIGFGSKVSYGTSQLFDLKTTVAVSDGAPTATECTAEKKESTSGLDKLLNVLTFGLYANTDVKIGVSVTDPGSASFDSVTINGKAATAEGGKYYITTGDDYADTGVTVVFMKGENTVKTEKIKEITELTTITPISIDENYPVVVTDTRPSAVYGSGSGTTSFSAQPSFEIPIKTESGKKNGSVIGLYSFNLDIYSGAEAVAEKKIASFTCDGTSVTAGAGNEYDIVLTTGTNSAYSASAVEAQDYTLKINKADVSKALKNGIYTAVVNIENNAGNKLENDSFTFNVERNAAEVGIDVSGEGNVYDDNTKKIYDDKATVKFSFADDTLDLAKLQTGEYFKYKLDGNEVSPTEWTKDGDKFVTSVEVSEEGGHKAEAVYIKDGIGNETNLDKSVEFAVDKTEAKIETVYKSTPTNNLLSVLSFGIYRTSDEVISVDITVSDAVAGVDENSIKVFNSEENITSEFDFTSTDEGHTFKASAQLRKDVAYRLRVEANDNIKRNSPSPVQELKPDEMKDGGNVKEIAVTDDVPAVIIRDVPTAQVNSSFTAKINAVSDGAAQGADPGLKALDVKVYYSEQKPTAEADGSYNVDGLAEAASFTDNGKEVSAAADEKFVLSRTSSTDTDFAKAKVKSCDYSLAVDPAKGIESGYYIIKATGKNNVDKSTDAYSVFEIDTTLPEVSFRIEESVKYTDNDTNTEYFDQKATLIAEITDNHINADLLNNDKNKFVYTLTNSGDGVFPFGTWEDKDGKTVASIELDSEDVYTFTPATITDDTGNTKDISANAKRFAVDSTEAKITTAYSVDETDSILQALSFGVYRTENVDVTITVEDETAGVKSDSIKVKNGSANITSSFDFTTDDGGHTYKATATLDRDVAYVLTVDANDNINRAEPNPERVLKPDGMTSEGTTKEIAVTETAPAISIDGVPANQVNSDFTAKINTKSINKTQDADPGLRSLNVKVYYTEQEPTAEADGSYNVDGLAETASFTDNGKEVSAAADEKFVLSRTSSTDADFAETKVTDCDYDLAVAPKKGLESGYYIIKVTSTNNSAKDSANNEYVSTDAYSVFEIDLTDPEIEFTFSKTAEYTGDMQYFDQKVTLTATVNDKHINAALLNADSDKFTYSLTDSKDKAYAFGTWEDKDGKTVASVELDDEATYNFIPSKLVDETGNESDITAKAVDFAVDDTEADVKVSYGQSFSDVIAQVLTFGLYRSAEAEVTITVTDAISGINSSSIIVKNGEENITDKFEFSTEDNGHTYTATAKLDKNIAYVISVKALDNIGRTESENSANTTTIDPSQLTDDEKASTQTKEIASMEDKNDNQPLVTITEPENWSANSDNTLDVKFDVSSKTARADGEADPGIRSVKAELFYATSAAEKAQGNWQSVAEFNDIGNGVETVSGYSLTGFGTAIFSQTKTLDLSYTLHIADKKSGYYKLVVTAENNIIKTADGDSATYFTTTKEQLFAIDNDAPVLNVSYDNNTKKTVDGVDYYDNDRTLTIKITEVSFDLDYVKNNFSDIITEGTPKGEHQLKWEQPDNTKNEFVGTVTFTDYDDASDGHFTVNIPDFADMIGNNCIGYNESFIIDKTAPKISWKFEDENGVGPDNKYFSGSRKLTVNVEEHNFTLDDIEKTGTGAYLVYSMTSDGTDVAAGSKVIWLDWKENGENKFVGTYEFTDSEELLRDGEYTVVFTSLTDKAGNAAENSDFGKTETFVVDNTDPVITWEYDDHDGNLTTRVEKNSTVYYYDQMRTLKATIKEHNLTADDLNSGDYIDYSIKDEHGNELTLVWSATRNPDEYTASVDLDDLTDDDFDGKYTVVFRSLKDRAQRTAKNSNLGKTESFIIDKTEPVIKVEYLNDNGKWYQTDNDYQYFNDKSNPLTLKVTVTEHNFSADEIEEFISYSIVNEHGESISFDKWNHENGTNVFTAEYVFEDKSNDDTDGDYTVSVDSLNDKVGHKALDTDGAEFTGHSRDRIVIDYTAPVVNVEYDNNNSKTVDGAAYFDKNRTITVTVTDHGIKNAEDLVSLIDFAITSDETGNMVSRKVAADKWQKSGNTYTFKYTFQDTAHMSDGDFVVKFSGFTDPAGNKATDASGSVRDSFIDDRFVIDTTKPVISIDYKPAAGVQSYKNWTYYNSYDIVATITVDEYNFKNSADQNYNIADYEVVYITGQSTNKTTIDGGFSWTNAGGNKYVTYVRLPGNSRISRFDFFTMDKAGNTDEQKPAKSNFVIDDTAPTNLKISFSRSVMDIVLDVLTLGQYSKVTYGCYNASTTVTISAEDSTAGIEYLKYECIGNTGSRSFSGTVDMKSGNADPKPSQTYTFRVDPQFKGYVKLTAIDFSGNTTVYSTESDRKGIIVDDKNPLYENVKPVVNAAPQKAPRNNIYDGDVRVDVNVYDPVVNGVASGVYKVDYTITNPTTGYSESRTLKNTNTNVNTFDTNFVVDSNKFNSNNVKIRLIATDFAGNQSDPYNLTVDIDITKPTIKVEYQGGQANIVGGNEYYNSDRTAIITVTERNFDPADFEYKIENTIPIGIKSVPTMTSWTHSTNSADPDASTHVARIVYHEDGYYKFEMSFQDKAGNKATSPAPDQFRMDQTKPEISISFDNNSALNGNYYAAPRTATITVKELNFSWDEVKYILSATAADNTTSVPGPQLTNMSDSGDVHTAKVYFSEDGMFSFTVDNTDFAKNVADRKTESTFYLDQVIPELVITGVNNDVAYGGDVNINIAISDINYGGDHNYKLERIGVDGTRTDVTRAFGFEDSADGTSVILGAIANTKDNDGIYILSASAKDKAGNLHPETVRFSVNRFGSTYLLSDETIKINNKCIKDEQDVVIMEFNADPIIKDEIIVTAGGSTKTLTEGSEYSVEISGNAETWYKAVYTISKGVFAEEGNYEVMLKSKDNKLSTTNSNNDIDTTNEKRLPKLVVSFVVDKQPPMVSISGIEDNKPYRESTKTLTITLQDSNFSDKIGDNKITVTVGGKTYDVKEDQIKKTESGYVITIDLTGDGNPSDIVVTVTDKAGNVGTAKIENFTLRASELQMFLDNTVAVVLTIIGFLLLIAAIIIIIVVASRKKKKKNQS